MHGHYSRSFLQLYLYIYIIYIVSCSLRALYQPALEHRQLLPWPQPGLHGPLLIYRQLVRAALHLQEQPRGLALAHRRPGARLAALLTHRQRLRQLLAERQGHRILRTPSERRQRRQENQGETVRNGEKREEKPRKSALEAVLAAPPRPLLSPWQLPWLKRLTGPAMYIK